MHQLLKGENYLKGFIDKFPEIVMSLALTISVCTVMKFTWALKKTGFEVYFRFRHDRLKTSQTSC